MIAVGFISYDCFQRCGGEWCALSLTEMDFVPLQENTFDVLRYSNCLPFLRCIGEFFDFVSFVYRNVSWNLEAT